MVEVWESGLEGAAVGVDMPVGKADPDGVREPRGEFVVVAETVEATEVLAENEDNAVADGERDGDVEEDGERVTSGEDVIRLDKEPDGEIRADLDAEWLTEVDEEISALALCELVAEGLLDIDTLAVAVEETLADDEEVPHVVLDADTEEVEIVEIVSVAVETEE